MDLYEYLKNDHQKVMELFEKFENSKSVADKAGIVTMLAKEITLHSLAEQNTFYKKLEEHAGSKGKAQHGLKEHQEIDKKLEEIASTHEADSAWDEKILELKEMIKHHVDEEEGEMFTQAQKILSMTDEQAVQKEMQQFKEKLQESL